MKDWMLFGSLAFPPFFKVIVIGTLAWFLLRALLQRFGIEKYVWHEGLTEICLLIAVWGLVAWGIQ